MEYINYIKTKATSATFQKSSKPIVTEEDEKFLNQVTKQPLSAIDHGGDAQIALMNGAQNVPLPPETPSELTEEPQELTKTSQETDQPKRTTWSWLRRDSRDGHKNQKIDTADGLQAIANSLKADAESETDPDVIEAKREEQEMTMMLEQLNLAAVNNRVFSISNETQELLQDFNQVLKDLINGVPTAYRDLESLLTNGDKQIQKTYSSLPAFLQKWVEKLPETMTKGIAPEMMAAAAARASSYGINLEKTAKAAGSASKFVKTPSLKDLISKPGAVTAMLKSIMQFLRTRFPAFAGINVLWSIALFILLIVFWYCHKRGKEVRLENERNLTEQEVQQLEAEWKKAHPQEVDSAYTVPTTTTAPPGANMDQIRAGIAEVNTARIAAASQTDLKVEQPSTEAQLASPAP